MLPAWIDLDVSSKHVKFQFCVNDPFKISPDHFYYINEPVQCKIIITLI